MHVILRVLAIMPVHTGAGLLWTQNIIGNHMRYFSRNREIHFWSRTCDQIIMENSIRDVVRKLLTPVVYSSLSFKLFSIDLSLTILLQLLQSQRSNCGQPLLMLSGRHCYSSFGLIIISFNARDIPTIALLLFQTSLLFYVFSPSYFLLYF